MVRRALVLALIALTTPARAEEGGTLSAVLGPEPVTLSVWAGQSDFWGDASYGGVSIMARSEAGILSIGFETAGSNAALPEIAWRPNGDAGGYFADEDSGARISVSSIQLTDGELHLVGNATAELAYSSDFGRTRDTAKIVSATVDFDVTLAALE